MNMEQGVGRLLLQNITKTFGDFVAVDDLTLEIPEGSFFALLGPSGCGKTTTLRMVAGLEDPTQGSIYLGDQDVTAMRSYKRPVNTVFQSYALFPHLDIFENVAFGLRRRGVGKAEVKVKAMEALELVELAHVARRKPAQLSGGQQQRIALARAIVNRPKVLLLDEPLGALDLKLRRQMQIELKRIQTEVGITFIHVTHDQEEAMTMADTVAVMNHGRVEQLGAPVDLYELPRTEFVANFLGQSNIVPGNVTSSGDVWQVNAGGVELMIPAGRVADDAGAALIGVGFRPEKVHLLPAGSAAEPGHNTLRGGIVIDASFTGLSTQYLVKMPSGQELSVFAQNISAGDKFRNGDQVDLSWLIEHTFGLAASAETPAAVGA